jgi:hypothetical protein
VRIALLALVGCASAAPTAAPTTTAPTTTAASTVPTELPPLPSRPPEPKTAKDDPPEPDVFSNPHSQPLAVLQRVPGVAIMESRNFAQHGHGGPPASLDRVFIIFEIEDRRPHAISAQRVELLHASCRETAWRDRTPLHVTGYRLYRDTEDPIAKSPLRLALPAVPGEYSIEIAFTAIRAYQACDRFAFAVQLVVDGARIPLELPLDIKRLEPLRR